LKLRSDKGRQSRKARRT